MLDEHMWLSIGCRSRSSKFTRAQRLGSCLATIFLFMITNAMFFKDASEQQPSPLIMLGPISITGTQVYNSIMTSLIIFPPIILLVFIFSHSRPRYEDFHERSKDNKKCQLPFWCCYIGWFLVCLYVLVSAVFTIFYSMSWGKEKSTAWVQAFLLTVLESILVVQPFKVSQKFNLNFLKYNYVAWRLAQITVLLNNSGYLASPTLATTNRLGLGLRLGLVRWVT